MQYCRPLLLALLLTSAPQLALGQATSSAAYRDPTLPVSARVRDLLTRMTLDEKFWQYS